MRLLVFAAVAAGLAAAPASAQSRLPRTSPAEQQIDDINRSIERQQRNLGAQQNQQFETNQLRQDLRRQQTSPNITPPAYRQPGRICAPGQIAC